MRASPVSGCNSGSTQTLLQTSVNRLAVRSLISLCLIDGKPPLGQERAYSIYQELGITGTVGWSM